LQGFHGESAWTKKRFDSESGNASTSPPAAPLSTIVSVEPTDYEWARKLAYQMAYEHGTVWGVVDVDDCAQAAYEGFLKAARDFDPERGPFAPYAYTRMSYSLRDALRSGDFLSRADRFQLRAAAARGEDYAIGHLPARAGAYYGPVVIVEPEYGLIFEASTLPDTSELPGDRLLELEFEDDVREAVATLGDRERFIITLHYWENMPLTEIAKILGVSDGRVSQIETRAKQRLRERLALHAYA
jgi:RNA polymerase sigma factor FliA